MPGGSDYREPYRLGFRREAVELVRRGGRPVTEIACELGVSDESLSKWLGQAAPRCRRARGPGDGRAPGAARATPARPDTRARTGDPKKAAAFFARESETR